MIAAFIAQGVSNQLLEYCILHHSIITSEFILNEVKEKFLSKFTFSADRADEIDALLRSRFEIVKSEQLEFAVCRDPDDDNILAAALTGDCDCLITGDRDLLVLKEFNGIKILSPSEFIEYENSLG